MRIFKSNSTLFACLLCALTLSFVSCGDDDDNPIVLPTGPNFSGAVYAMTNAASTNSVVAYGRAADGTLTFISSTDTEGQGTGPMNVASGPGGNTFDPLASNYAIVMSEDNNFVFCVNAGSDEISSFSVEDDYSLTHVSTIASGGADPVGLATVNGVVYVINSNQGVGNLSGFTFDQATGELSAIANSNRALTGRPTAIEFSQDENQLVVAEVNTNTLHTFALSGSDLAAAPVTYTYPTPMDPNRNVPNPFGLETISQGGNQYVVIAEARVFTQGGMADPQTSSVGTFSLANDGSLTPVSMDVRIDADNDDATGPTAACWVVANASGDQVFTTNTFGNSLSSFDVNTSGEASLAQSPAFQEAGAFADDGLTDAVVAGNYLYQMEAASGVIVSLQIGADGTLTEIDRDTDLVTTGGNQGVTGF